MLKAISKAVDNKGLMCTQVDVLGDSEVSRHEFVSIYKEIFKTNPVVAHLAIEDIKNYLLEVFNE